MAHEHVHVAPAARSDTPYTLVSGAIEIDADQSRAPTRAMASANWASRCRRKRATTTRRARRCGTRRPPSRSPTKCSARTRRTRARRDRRAQPRPRTDAALPAGRREGARGGRRRRPAEKAPRPPTSGPTRWRRWRRRRAGASRSASLDCCAIKAPIVRAVAGGGAAENHRRRFGAAVQLSVARQLRRRKAMDLSGASSGAPEAEREVLAEVNILEEVDAPPASSAAPREAASPAKYQGGMEGLRRRRRRRLRAIPAQFDGGGGRLRRRLRRRQGRRQRLRPLRRQRRRARRSACRRAPRRRRGRRRRCTALWSRARCHASCMMRWATSTTTSSTRRRRRSERGGGGRGAGDAVRPRFGAIPSEPAVQRIRGALRRRPLVGLCGTPNYAAADWTRGSPAEKGRAAAEPPTPRSRRMSLADIASDFGAALGVPEPTARRGTTSPSSRSSPRVRHPHSLVAVSADTAPTGAACGRRRTSSCCSRRCRRRTTTRRRQARPGSCRRGLARSSGRVARAPSRSARRRCRRTWPSW